MANELEVVGFNPTTPQVPFGGSGATRGITQLREASGQLKQLLDEKFQAVAVDQAAKQGQADVLSGSAPKTLAPSGLNAVTQAYNHSVLRSTAEVFKQDYTAAKEGLDEALATGDKAAAQQYGKALDGMIDYYGERHPDIKLASKGLKKQLAEDVLIGRHVGEFAGLGADSTEANEYLGNFVTNPPADLTVAQQQKAAKKMWEVRNTQSHLQSQAQAQQLARYENDMVQGLYPSTDEIMADPVLSDIQKIKLDTEVKKTESKDMAGQLRVAQAQQQIIMGNAGGVSKKTVGTMFDQSNVAFQAANGRPPGMMEMAMNIAGATNTPTSGLVGTSVDTNVPQFDAIVASNISSGDPVRQAEAVAAYSYLVNQLGNPNLINLSGQEANFAVTGSILLRGGDIPSEEVMNKLNNAIYKTSELDRKVRGDRFNREIARTLPKKFKEVFGVKPGEAGNDLAQGYFNNLYSTNYMISGDVDSSLATTRYMMRGWGESKYSPDNGVMFAPPEITYPLSQGLPNVIDNQLKYRVQQLINDNPNIKWAEKPELNIDLQDQTEGELVYGNVRPRFNEDKVANWITIDGHKSKVYLVSGADVLNNASGNPVYHMYYEDRYGNSLPIPDPTDKSGIAKIMLQPLDRWAPQIAQEEGQKIKKDAYLAARRKLVTEKFGMLPQPLKGAAGAIANTFGFADSGDDIDDLKEEIGKLITGSKGRKDE